MDRDLANERNKVRNKVRKKFKKGFQGSQNTLGPRRSDQEGMEPYSLALPSISTLEIEVYAQKARPPRS